MTEENIFDARMRQMNNLLETISSGVYRGCACGCGHGHTGETENDGGSQVIQRYRIPLTDIVEHEKEFVFKMELPGLDKDNIKIKLHDNYLELTAEKKTEVEDKSVQGFYSIERSYSGFHRNFRLPQNIDRKSVNAEYNDGILEIRLAKMELPKKDAGTDIPVK